MGTREKRIGIRELKSTLSECVREVRAGRTIVVTDHGQPVARIIPEAVSLRERVEAFETQRLRQDGLAGRLVLFVDAALYRPYWLLAYSRQGELLRDTMCAQRWSRSADRNMNPRTCEAVSFSVKYKCPVFHSRQFESSPSTQTS